MDLKQKQSTDVVVIGSGLAGLAASLEVADAGCSVMLVSLGSTLSGSSFFGGTWGLGLVGPEDAQDIDDLIEQIERIGGGVVDRELAQILVEGIDDTCNWLIDQGITLKEPLNSGQRAYIPCFDYKQRRWRGLVRSELMRIWDLRLGDTAISYLARHELIDILVDNNELLGVLLFDHATEELVVLGCTSLVLTTGGAAGLYRHRLTGDDVISSVHGIALLHGARLINAEFLQMMLAMVEPHERLILNEKALRYAKSDYLQERFGSSVQDLLEQRSGYGPFSSRPESAMLDLAIAQRGEAGIKLHFEVPDKPDELVADYFSWLKATHNIRPDDTIRARFYAHASNGGVAIDTNAQVHGMPLGVFAAGEFSGGMHGADRLGGLASANALVFGRIAGKSAAHHAGNTHSLRSRGTRGERDRTAYECAQQLCSVSSSLALPQVRSIIENLQHIMSTHAMVIRNHDGLSKVQAELARYEELLDAEITDVQSLDARVFVNTQRTRHQIRFAQAMTRAMFARTSSLGSHFRSDST